MIIVYADIFNVIWAICSIERPILPDTVEKLCWFSVRIAILFCLLPTRRRNHDGTVARRWGTTVLFIVTGRQDSRGSSATADWSDRGALRDQAASANGR